MYMHLRTHTSAWAWA